MAFIKELLDEAVSSCFVASTCHTRQQAADELMKATVIDLQECLLRRHLLASKKSQILFIHQLDN